ncbi:MAG TPA: hypothetical protein VND19_09090 [Acetobacteraceae bacterium]|nr:hypothetical protein [Acetobacteraceae bacterium]
MAEGNHAQAMLQIAHMATRARRQDLLAAFVQQHGWTVQAGLFAGMVLPSRACWGDGDLLPKLLGCYEAELHEALTSFVETKPGLIVNVGAAEGYYAVGLARLLPGAFAHAFDSADAAADICREAARLNGVEARLSIVGTCTPELLQLLLPHASNPLLVRDCEGYERDLLDPRKVPALAGATIVAECHDFIDALITRTLAEQLGASHELYAVREGARDPSISAFLQPFNSLDRWIAVCEYRPCMMHWLVARPKVAA